MVFQQRIKNVPLYFRQSGIFLATRSITRINVGRAELCEAFTWIMENICVQFEGMVYQQIVGIPIGTNCTQLITDLFLFCYERDFCITFTNRNSTTL